MRLPAALERLADLLIGLDGAEVVALGGSRAMGREHPDSDWDLGLYYRDAIDLGPLAAYGEVAPPGTWGRLMNGGSWLTVEGVRVDVLLRDLTVVEHWMAEARVGRFDVDGLLGYIAGFPTYTLGAEASINQVIRGGWSLDTTFPDALAEAGPARWRFCRDFSLYHAEAHARRGNSAAALGQAARAVLEEAHAVCCEQRTWVINEKYLVEMAGLGDLDGLFDAAGTSRSPADTIAELTRLLPLQSVAAYRPAHPGAATE